MSTATASRQNGQTQQVTSEDIARLLEKAISSTPLSVRTKGIEKALLSGVSKIEAALPDILSGQAERLVRRAIIYFQMSPKLDDATPESLMMCVIKAAEMGLPLDGKLCHAVCFNNSYKDEKGNKYWVNEAVPMPDYRGLVAVAKRTKLITDIYADVVCENDDFTFKRTRDNDVIEHSYDLRTIRGKVIGTYCKVKPKHAPWRFEIMTRGEVEDIREKSKAKDNGPWKTPDSNDWKQMAKKSVLRRVLQLFMEDPGLAAAVNADEAEYITDTASETPPAPPKRQKLSDIAPESEQVPSPTNRRQQEQEPQSTSQMEACAKWLSETRGETGVTVSQDCQESESYGEWHLPNGGILIVAETDRIPKQHDESISTVDCMEPDALSQVKNIVGRARKKR